MPFYITGHVRDRYEFRSMDGGSSSRPSFAFIDDTTTGVYLTTAGGFGIASPNGTMTIVGDVSATSFSGIGGGLTHLNASNLSSGTVGIDRLPDASTSAQGVVQLTDSTSTTSSSIAATATAVKSLADGKVSKSGDTMTGALDIDVGGTSLNLGKNTNSLSAAIGFYQYDSSISANRRHSYIGQGSSGNQDLLIASDQNNVQFFINGGYRATLTNTGRLGIGTTSPAYTLDVAGTARVINNITADSNITLNGSTSKLVVMNGQDGGNKGINMWALNTKAYGIYVGQSGAGKSFAEGTAVAGNGFASFAVRFRVYDASTHGFIFENHTENLLMSLRASDGYMYVAGNLATGGNVGIGTTSPGYALDITSTGIPVSRLLTSITGYSTYNMYENTVSNSKGYIGVDGVGLMNSSPGHMTIASSSGKDIILAPALSEKMRVTSDGKVGIGTTSPAYTLHVEGDAHIQGSVRINNTFTDSLGPSAPLSVGWYTIATSSNGRASGRFFVYDGTSGLHQGVVFYATHFFGNSGINIVSTGNYNNGYRPIGAIRTKGNGTYDGMALQIYLSANSSGIRVSIYESEGSNYWQKVGFIPDATDPGGLSGTYSSFVQKKYVDVPLPGGTNQSGPLGLNIMPSYQLDLSNDGARKLTTTTWLTGSDRRIKDDIEDANIEICYDTVKSLPLKRFRWTDSYVPDEPDADRHSLGWIAQDVRDVFPKAVSASESHGYDDFLSLNTDQLYKTMWGALTKVIQQCEEQQKIIESLEKRVSST